MSVLLDVAIYAAGFATPIVLVWGEQFWRRQRNYGVKRR